MSRPTVKLMEELLKMIDEQQAQTQPQVQRPTGRATVQIKTPPETVEMLAPNTSAFPRGRRQTKAIAEDKET